MKVLKNLLSIHLTPNVFFVMVFILLPVFDPMQREANPITFFLILILVPLFIYVKTKKGNNRSISKKYAYCLLLSAILSTILGGGFSNDILKLTVLVMLFVLYDGLNVTSTDLISIFRAYVVVGVLLAVLIIMSFLAGIADNEGERYIGRFSIGIIGLSKNPNYIASYITSCFFILTYILVNGSSNLFNKVIIILLLFIMTVGVFLTGTRAGLISIIMAIGLSFVNNIENRKTIVTLVIIIASVLFIASSYSDQIDNLMSSYLGQRKMLEDDGRSLSWAFAFNSIQESPLFGYGLSAWQRLATGTLFLEYLHNIFLEIFISQGIIGVLCVMLIVFSGFKYANDSDKKLIISFLIITAFPLMFQNGYIASNFWRFIIVNRLFINYSIHTGCVKKDMLNLI